MKIKLPAVNEPIIRVLVLTPDELHRMDFCGERPQEVDVRVEGVVVEQCKVGYVGVAGSGEEVGDPVLLYEPAEPAKKPEPKPEPAPEKPAEQPAAELPPETVKVEEKVEVKTSRKK